MSKSWSGMDPDAIRSLGEQLKRVGSDLESLAGRLNTVTGRAETVWAGRDLDRFRRSWSQTLHGQLRDAAESVKGLGRAAINNADEQQQTSDSVGHVGRHKSPSSTGGFLDQARGGDMSTDDGVRIQSGIGPDGHRKVIVYIDGTFGDKYGRLDPLDNLSAVAGQSEMTDYIMSKLKGVAGPLDDVLIVGYSQGGLIAEDVAWRGDFKSTTVITEAAPRLGGSHGDVDVLRLNARGLVNDVIGLPGASADAINHVVHPDQYAADTGVDSRWNAERSLGGKFGQLLDPLGSGVTDHMDHDLYRSAAADFERSQNPDDVLLQGKIAGFQNLTLDYDSDRIGLSGSG